MKSNIYKTTAIFLLFTSVCFAQLDYAKYPSYKTVVSSFFTKYSVADVSSINLLNFLKKPDGWHVVIFKSSPEFDTIIKDDLLWSLKTGSFQPVNYPKVKNEDENAKYIDGFMQLWGARWFDLFPYYNYRGWAYDVIENYKDVNNLPDSIIYAVGRASSYFASELLDDNSGFSDPRYRFKIGSWPNALNKDQLEKYRKYHNLAISKYKQLIKVNPGYKTIVGSIKDKLPMEYVVGYLDLMRYADDNEALKELPDNIFDDFSISMAKNTLMSCEPNSILFTDGDYGTYPLIYVQAKYKFRTDVMVLNSKLLEFPTYTERWRHKFLDAPGLPLSFSADELKPGERDYTYLDHKSPNIIDLKTLITIDKKNDTVINKHDKEGAYRLYPTAHFLLMHNNDSVLWGYRRQYLFKEQVILFDILATNNWVRPIYFAVTAKDNTFTGLYEYVEVQGLVCKLTSKTSTTLNQCSKGDYASMNIPVAYNNFMKQYLWKGIDEADSYELTDVGAYQIYMAYLAEVLVRNNMKDSAKNIMKKYLDLFPNERFPFDIHTLPLISAYYELGDTANANKIVNTLIVNIGKKSGNYPKEKGAVTFSDDPLDLGLQYILQQYGCSDLLSKLQRNE